MSRKRQQGLRLLRQFFRSLLAASALAILSLDLARKVSGTWICRMQLPSQSTSKTFQLCVASVNTMLPASVPERSILCRSKGPGIANSKRRPDYFRFVVVVRVVLSLLAFREHPYIPRLANKEVEPKMTCHRPESRPSRLAHGRVDAEWTEQCT